MEKKAFATYPDDKPGEADERMLDYMKSISGDGVVFIPKSWIDRPGSIWPRLIAECDWLKSE